MKDLEIPNIPAVWAKGLVKKFNGLLAVNNIDFEVKQGECLGFLGPNGAGKTTTIKMVYGMTPPTQGNLKVLGMEISKNYRLIRKHLGVLPQENNLDVELNVLENLEVYGNYFGIPKTIIRQKAQELLSFLNLEEKINTPIDALSGGMKRRLLLARSLLNDPKLLVLDEPTTGLDPQARHLIWEKLRHLKTAKISQILTTHYMEEATQLCDRVIIMDQGRIIAQGEPQKLVNKHVSREVLELRISPHLKKKAISLLKTHTESIESHNDLLFFYTSDAENLYQLLLTEKIKVENALYRHSTLEDVFLKLTGRRLRE